MPTATLLPTAAGTYSSWTNGAGTVPTNVQTNDGNTTYVKVAGGAGGISSYALDDLPGAAVSVTGSVSSYAVLRRLVSGGGTHKIFQRQNATDVSGAALAAVTTSFVLYSTGFATAPDASAWTPAKVNSLESGMNRSAAGASEVRCTQAYTTAVYVLGGGGFIYLLANYILPLLGAAVPLASMRAVAADLNQVSRNLITPDEYTLAHRELTEYRWPHTVTLQGA